MGSKKVTFKKEKTEFNSTKKKHHPTHVFNKLMFSHHTNTFHFTQKKLMYTYTISH